MSNGRETVMYIHVTGELGCHDRLVVAKAVIQE